jgi:type II secretion system (T2SS) protein M
MMPTLPPWKHAALSFSILLLLITSIYFLVVQPALSINQENKQRFEYLSFQLEKYGDTEQKIKSLNTQIKQLKENNPNDLDFLKKKTSALVAADLQKMLKTLIETNGGNLVSTHAVTKPKDEVFSNVTIKVHMRCNITTLRTVLYKLSANKPLLFTDNILIQKKNISASRRKQNRNSDKLEIRFDVTGYINQSAS